MGDSGQSWADAALLVRMFCMAPRTVGSIAPSSRSLARAITSKVAVDASTHVVELGVGTGALTRALLSAGLGPHQYTGVELQSELVAALRQGYPALRFVHGSARNLRRILDHRNVAPSQVVASLPWSTLEAGDRRACLAGIADSLPAGGRLLTYSYVTAPLLPAGRQAQNDFRRVFGEVRRSRIVWRNLPPAIVWTCTK